MPGPVRQFVGTETLTCATPGLTARVDVDVTMGVGVKSNKAVMVADGVAAGGSGETVAVVVAV